MNHSNGSHLRRLAVLLLHLEISAVSSLTVCSSLWGFQNNKGENKKTFSEESGRTQSESETFSSQGNVIRYSLFLEHETSIAR